MSPTDFTDSHRLLVCVCLNLLRFHRFYIPWWNFRICVNLCNLWEFFVVCNLWEFFVVCNLWELFVVCNQWNLFVVCNQWAKLFI